MARAAASPLRPGRFLSLLSLLVFLALLPVARSDSDFSDHDQRLLQWVMRRGAKIAPIKIAEIPGRGRGIVAAKNLKAGDLIFMIPRARDTFVNINDLRETPLWEVWLRCKKELLRLSEPDTQQHLFVALYLIWHQRQGEDSRLAPYIDSLPKTFHHISSWTRDEMLELSYTTVYEYIALFRRNVRHDFSYLEELLESPPFRGLFEPPLQWDEFKHMLDVVLARDFKANDGDAVIELIPGFDLMNHDEDPNVNYVKSGSSSRLVELYLRCTVLVTARRDIKSGEELTITYGSKSAHGFLRVYGFIPEGLNVTTIPVRYQIDRFDANRRLKEALFLEHSESIVAGPGHVAQALNVLRVLLNDDTRVLTNKGIVERCLKGARLSISAEDDVIDWYLARIEDMQALYPAEEYRGRPVLVPAAKASATVREIVKLRDMERDVVDASLAEALEMRRLNHARESAKPKKKRAHRAAVDEL